jgi:hypothetical protein
MHYSDVFRLYVAIFNIKNGHMTVTTIVDVVLFFELHLYVIRFRRTEFEGFGKHEVTSVDHVCFRI